MHVTRDKKHPLHNKFSPPHEFLPVTHCFYPDTNEHNPYFYDRACGDYHLASNILWRSAFSNFLISKFPI